jgi:glycosyltransferase involved in cell wall biosynthesis
MHNLQLSILMPAFNAGKYIREAIGSILCQTFTDYELIIVNDGSTDDTSDIISSFEDDRIHEIKCPHRGVAASLNTGLAHARGKYIARFDADDICHPHRLERQFVFLEQHPDYVLVGSDAEYIMEDGEHLFRFSCPAHTDKEIRQQVYRICPFIHSAVMYNKQAVINAGGYPVYAHNFEDYLLWTQLLTKGKLHNLPEPLLKVRFNASSVTIDEKWRGRRFRRLKRDIIRKGSISRDEGEALLAIIRKQDSHSIKEGAYHALCGKKLLVNNYQPLKARKHICFAIRYNPIRLDNYALLAASYLPHSVITWLHGKGSNK